MVNRENVLHLFHAINERSEDVCPVLMAINIASYFCLFVCLIYLPASMNSAGINEGY